MAETTILQSYLERVEKESPGISATLKPSIKTFSQKYLNAFNFNEHQTGLLFGHVQSGKTSQIFGIIASAVENGFKLFILLTSDNIFLQKQTIERAFRTLDALNICDETDYVRLREGALRKPTLLVLKKNQSVLRTWRSHLASLSFVKEQPFFIVDDEGDVASLNTKVNQNQQSEINRLLTEIRQLSPSSLYLQVTATPQALILQSIGSNWRPSFTHYFEPGESYLGGEYFYTEQSSVLRGTDEHEGAALLRREDPPEGLRKAMNYFLVSGIHLLEKEGAATACFLIHPSVRILDHDKVKGRIENLMRTILRDLSKNSAFLELAMKDAWEDLKKTHSQLAGFDEIFPKITDYVKRTSVIVLNSRSHHTTHVKPGLNIIIGGNTLGRGLTIPKLHTVYYCRSAKTPQVDTSWQHSRIFGYDRIGGLCRVLLPPSLRKLFREFHEANESLFGVLKTRGIEEVSIISPSGTKPTRPNVVKRSEIGAVHGGVNYFPNSPSGKNRTKLDAILGTSDGERVIPLKSAYELVNFCESEDKSDWDERLFSSCILALEKSGIAKECRLIVRTERSIAKGTGTLLSPNDRSLVASYPKDLVLVMYRLIGEKENHWTGQPLWVPNIKFPSGKIFSKNLSNPKLN